MYPFILLPAWFVLYNSGYTNKIKEFQKKYIEIIISRLKHIILLNVASGMADDMIILQEKKS